MSQQSVIRSSMLTLSRKKKVLIVATVVIIATIVVSLVVSTTLQHNSQLPPQQADANFNASVANPAFNTTNPIVLFDEAHNNFHTMEGSYKPFADLLTNDGYTVIPNHNKFTIAILENCSVLVIVNALGKNGGSAFSQAECDAVAQWIKAGGSLLLIADHNPFGSSAQALSNGFGVSMSGGGTIDSSHADFQNGGNSQWLIYSRENGLLDNDSITNGRNSNETVNFFETFAGQSLKGPEGSIPLLKLSDSAVDILPSGKTLSDAGRSQGVALQYGKGRVVVLGEAVCLTAQLTRGGGVQAGMNRKGIDNKQMALNVMHWLSGIF